MHGNLNIKIHNTKPKEKLLLFSYTIIIVTSLLIDYFSLRPEFISQIPLFWWALVSKQALLQNIFSVHIFKKSSISNFQVPTPVLFHFFPHFVETAALRSLIENIFFSLFDTLKREKRKNDKSLGFLFKFLPNQRSSYSRNSFFTRLVVFSVFFLLYLI